MVIALVASVIFLAVIIFVLQPLFTRKPSYAYLQGSLGNPEDSNVHDMALEALADIETDYRLGKLSEDDYRQLRIQYRELVSTTAGYSTDSAESDLAYIDRQIEHDLSMIKANQPVTEVQELVCPRCSAKVDKDDLFCSKCGAKLRTTSIETTPDLQPHPHATKRVRLPSLDRKRKALISIVIACLLFALATAGIYLQQTARNASARAVGTIPSNNVQTIATYGSGDLVFAGDGTTIWKSTDGGKTWESLSGIQGNVTSISAIDNRLFAVVNFQVWTSADQGDSWSRISSAPKLVAITTDSESSKIYGFDAEGNLYIGSNNGTTWDKTTGPEQAGISSATIASVDPLVIFGSSPAGVFVGTQGAWGSANGTVNGALPTKNVRYVAYDRSSGERGTLPNGGNIQGTLYAATDMGLFKSTDYGTSWVKIGLSKDLRALAIGDDVMYAVDSAGNIYVSHDKGVSWSGK